MKKKKEILAKNPVKTRLVEANIEEEQVEGNNHCTLLEFEEVTIVLEELQKRVLVIIQLKDIMSVSVLKNYCSIHIRLVESAVVFKITLTKLMGMLPGNYFWMVHHSNIVGRKHIFKFIPNCDGGVVLLLHDKTEIDVSPGYREIVKKAVTDKAHFLSEKGIKFVPKVKKGGNSKKRTFSYPQKRRFEGEDF